MFRLEWLGPTRAQKAYPVFKKMGFRSTNTKSEGTSGYPLAQLGRHKYLFLCYCIALSHAFLGRCAGGLILSKTDFQNSNALKISSKASSHAPLLVLD